MVEQVLGAASVLIVILAYVLCVQAMTAAIIVLTEFIALQVRKLILMLPEPQKPKEPEQPPYKVGGGLLKW